LSRYSRLAFLGSVSRSELVPWLQEQIAEQKRIDAETSGIVIQSEHSQGPARSKWSGSTPDVQLVLPGDTRKQRKQTKQIFLEKGEGPACRQRLRFSGRSLTFFPGIAFEMGLQVYSAAQSGIPVIAIDTPANVFDILCQSSSWVTDDETWRTVASSFTLSSTGYAPQIREAISRRHAEGHPFVLLFSVRDERVHLFAL
jgi:eukaryotic translation initiation factor 2-alpha kinase 4